MKPAVLVVLALLLTVEGYAGICRRLLSNLVKSISEASQAANPYRHLNRANLEYLNSWREKVNPEGRPFRLLNGAIGADFSTPFLVTNATEVLGVDLYPFNAERIRHFVKNWDLVDRDTDALPPPDPSNVLGRRFQKPLPLDRELIRQDFLNSLELRRVRGYWDNNILAPWSHERLLVYELKSLGVPQESVVVEGVKEGEIKISFDWGDKNLGIENRRRTVTLVEGDLDDYFNVTPESRGQKKFDAYLQKAIPVPEVYDASSLQKVPAWLNDRSQILYTATAFHTKEKEAARAQALSRNTGYALLPGDARREAEVEAYVLRRNQEFIKPNDPWDKNHAWYYGWKIFGLQRNFSPRE